MPSPKPTVRLLDGGMGTYLESHHAVIFDSSKPAWSSSVSPSLLRTVHEEYARSGADILLTASYQATAENMDSSGNHGTTVQGRESGVRKLTELVRTCTHLDVQDWRGEVALSLGPYGATMVPSTEYSGAYETEMQSEGALRAWHLRRLRDYAFAGEEGASTRGLSAEWDAIDIVAFETLVSRAEVRAVRGAMSSLSSDLEQPNKKFWVSVNFPHGSAEEPLSPKMETAEAVVRAMFEADGNLSRPWAIGVNCTKLDKIDAVIRGFEAGLLSMQEANMEWPSLIVYPDGAYNLRYNTTTKTWDPIDERAGVIAASWAAQMEALLQQIILRGRWSSVILGGCCKTTPDDIAELRQRLADDQSVQLHRAGASKVS